MLLDPFLPENYSDPQVWAYFNEDERLPSLADSVAYANKMRLRAGLNPLPAAKLYPDRVPNAGALKQRQVDDQQLADGRGPHRGGYGSPLPCLTATPRETANGCGVIFPMLPVYTYADIPF